MADQEGTYIMSLDPEEDAHLVRRELERLEQLEEQEAAREAVGL